MQKLDFGNCWGQTLDFPFRFFSVFVTQLTTEGLSWLTAVWRGKLPAALDVVDSDSTHAAMATDSSPLLVTLLLLAKRQHNVSSWVATPLLPFPAFVTEGKSSRMKECGWCQREREKGIRGGWRRQIYLPPICSDWQESDKFQHHLQLHYQTHWIWFQATNQPKNHRLYAPLHPTAQFSNSG